MDLRDCQTFEALEAKLRAFVEQLYPDQERRFATDVTSDADVDPDDAVELIEAVRAKRPANVEEALATAHLRCLNPTHARKLFHRVLDFVNGATRPPSDCGGMSD